MTALFAANACGTGTYELWDNALSNTNDDYGETISYDLNGNILTYERKGTSAVHTQMDKLEYFYTGGTNRLDRLQDDVDHLYYDNDVDNQGGGNYSYDETGNLTADQQADISVDWTVYGKIKSISRYSHSGTAWGTDYSYDAGGNRISKKVIRQGREGAYSTTTWYVRDAQGAVLATYEGEAHSTLYLTEQHIYGSSRLGMLHGFTDMDADPAGTVSVPLLGMGDTLNFERGRKVYELTNHLGNVLVTISDKKRQHDGGSGVVDYYMADVLSAQDYYSFGMVMPERNYTYGSGYRYGFNGKENDNEVKGEGNQQDYGMRIYDPRLGRFLSVDPLTSKYPELTPYQFASNRPIDGIDLDGLEWSIQTKSPSPNGKGGKTEVVYTIKISLAGSSNTVKLSNPNDKAILETMRTEAEGILGNIKASGTVEDPIVKVNIIFTEDDGPLKLNIRPFVAVSDKDSKTKQMKASGDPLANAQTKTVGNSQENEINLATSIHFVIKTDGKISIRTNPQAIGSQTYGRTLAHELSHTVGLYHSFSDLNNLEEIKDKPENLDRVRNNLMNSTGGGDEREERYKTNEGKELVPAQRKIIQKTVTEQQKAKPNGT